MLLFNTKSLEHIVEHNKAAYYQALMEGQKHCNQEQMY